MSIRRFPSYGLAFAMVVLLSLSASAASGSNIKHVLLISVDGLHALDVARYVESHPNSALAQLAGHGITYTCLLYTSPSPRD